MEHVPKLRAGAGFLFTGAAAWLSMYVFSCGCGWLAGTTIACAPRAVLYAQEQGVSRYGFLARRTLCMSQGPVRNTRIPPTPPSNPHTSHLPNSPYSPTTRSPVVAVFLPLSSAILKLRAPTFPHSPDDAVHHWLVSSHHPITPPALPPPLQVRALRNVIVSLGPFFIKLGQALSIRPDILSPKAMVELQQLCDKVRVRSVNPIVKK